MAQMMSSRQMQQLNNGRQIYIALRTYADETGHDGRFPAAHGTGASRELFANSNDALASLLPKYLDDKKAFFNRRSAYCVKLPENPETKNQLLAGECDWAYVRGLGRDTRADWPVLANAFAPGTTTYVPDPGKKGGVYRGENAVVIWAGGSAEVVETKKKGDVYFAKRPDKPDANVFEKDGDWLKGDDVKVLEPK
jgi:hypothetical protein